MVILSNYSRLSYIILSTRLVQELFNQEVSQDFARNSVIDTLSLDSNGLKAWGSTYFMILELAAQEQTLTRGIIKNVVNIWL